MKRVAAVCAILFALTCLSFGQTAASTSIPGFRDAAAEIDVEKRFMSVPDPARAEQHLRTLTAVPHVAGSPEDKQTAEYVAQQYRAAGLDTSIVEYKVWLNYPAEVSVDVVAPSNVKMHGPSREQVNGDSFQNDPRVIMAFNGLSPSGDVEAEVVYANYGRLEDVRKLKELGIDVRGKILLVRYGQNFRGVKSFVAQEAGAAGVIIYSDPIDDGWFKGDKYPKGPWRPDSGVQRGSIGYMFEFPGDPTTPGVASVMSLPDSQRIAPQQSAEMPKIPTTPLAYSDAAPILENLAGPASPRDWQGALPFTYHVGPGPVRVKIHLKQNYAYRTIWDVIGVARGSEAPEQWIVSGNHRDAWVFGAVDPNSGTAAQLEAVCGIGALLKSGWRPKRTLVFGSWDAEEYGLIGSTEWGEEHQQDLNNAAAYFNMDVGVAGPNFGSSAVPSLKQFIRDVTKSVPSPKGGTVYEAWQNAQKKTEATRSVAPEVNDHATSPKAQVKADVPVGDLGSGSDYTVFLQHLGVPSSDVGSHGPYGVYHSAFDNFDWFKKFGDPTFAYEQQMARVYGVQAIRMASADVLPYDYETYGKEIAIYIETAQKKAATRFADKKPDFTAARQAADHLAAAGAQIAKAQAAATGEAAVRLNRVLIASERGFLTEGLPNRPWYKHAIYAPGEYTGYEAVVIPGVNEAIDKGDLPRTVQQIGNLAAAIERVAKMLESYR